jgi:antirestriction protein ArdC
MSMESMNCRLTTKKAIYKNVIQVISIHRQSKKRQYHAYFATTLHKMQHCTAMYISVSENGNHKPMLYLTF